MTTTLSRQHKMAQAIGAKNNESRSPNQIQSSLICCEMSSENIILMNDGEHDIKRAVPKSTLSVKVKSLHE